MWRLDVLHLLDLGRRAWGLGFDFLSVEFRPLSKFRYSFFLVQGPLKALGSGVEEYILSPSNPKTLNLNWTLLR